MHKAFMLKKFIVVFFAALLCMMPASVFAQQTAAKKVKIQIQVCNGVQYVNMKNVADFYGMQFIASTRNVAFRSKYSKLVFTINSRQCKVNGAQVYLSHPVRLQKDTYLIGKSDFQLLLEPILRPASIKDRKKIATVLVDPGHGGKDAGAINGSDYEKDINLQVALRLAYKLQARGFKVYMTRNKDTDITLAQRVDFAGTIKADLFVSLHCNSAGPTVSGVETYIATPNGDPSVGDTLPTKVACTTNKYDKPNAFLGYYVHKFLLSKTKCLDRGLRRKRFYVIRNTDCPSMLVEMGFISNKNELAALKEASRQEQIADAIVEGIVRYNNP